MSRQKYEHPFENVVLHTTSDFDPALDVSSAGGTCTDSLNQAIEEVRAHPAPTPARKIHLLRGAPGHGKTHLFGRVKHLQGDRVEFVFVPAPPEPGRATAHAAWHVVETLFHSTNTFAPLRAYLARVLAPSFAAYFDQLPGGLQVRCEAVRQALADDPVAVLEVFGPVGDLVVEPFCVAG